ncbi:adaptin N terminal region-domain-containing protein [Syncephalis plumigaleata]|nr:adaptin N terminal region-domain-containing protein [Syncephalis plumigaleata]
MADYLARAAQTAAQLSKRLTDTVTETTRELAFDTGSRYLETAEDRLQDIKHLLESRYDREQLEGLKRLVALISKGWNVAEFFPHVVKLVASRNIDIRKLVYIYLLRYAAQEPDLSLLSINTFQRDLGDANQFIRAMALRVMTGIRVPSIAPLLVLGVRKCATDTSPYVRKTAALAISKCALLDPTRKADLIDILVQLLHDRSPLVIGSVMSAYLDLCPERFDLLHQHFRRLCHMLIDADEWGQIAILEVLTRYARTQFVDPRHVKRTTASTTDTTIEKFYESDDSTSDRHDTVEPSNGDENATLDHDHELLLKSSMPLLHHRNSAVVMAAISLLFHIGTQDDMAKITTPLTRILHGSRETEYTILLNIKNMVEKRPDLFFDTVKPFYLRITDPVIIGRLKLEILTRIVTDTTAQNIADELFAYIKFPRKELVILVVRAIGRFISKQPTYTNVCLRRLMHYYDDDNAQLVGEIAAVTRHILSQQTDCVSIDNMSLYLTHLISIFFTTKSAIARTNIVWLASHYSLRRLENTDLTPLPREVVDCVASYTPNILRELVRQFPDEDNSVKLQALRLGLIMALTGGQTEKRLFLHLSELARYDLNYDVRDCARWIRGFAVNNGISKDADDNDNENTDTTKQLDQLTHPASSHWYRYIGSFTLDTKDITATTTTTNEADPLAYPIGSLSLVVNQPMSGYEPLPDWPAVQPDSSVRNVPEPTPIDPSHGKSKPSQALSNARKMWLGSAPQNLDEREDATEEEEEEYTTTEEEDEDEEDELISDSYEEEDEDDNDDDDAQHINDRLLKK